MSEWVRLEYREGSSNKFWQWKKDEDRKGWAIVAWGRIGTRGSYQNVTIDEAAKRYAEKVRKGYQLIQRQSVSFDLDEERPSERAMRMASAKTRLEQRNRPGEGAGEKEDPEARPKEV